MRRLAWQKAEGGRQKACLKHLTEKQLVWMPPLPLLRNALPRKGRGSKMQALLSNALGNSLSPFSPSAIRHLPSAPHRGNT